jgi:hypothetical protein|tara:strand:+ start:444 stop:653 length:210 start_codon:yes stop_codon:yes gene_type:complete
MNDERKTDDVYKEFKRLVIERRNECYFGCGQKKGKKISESDAEYNLRWYNSTWMCSKCVRDKAGFYRVD